MARTVIIGAGLMGSAMAWPLSDNGHEVALVGTYLDDEIIETCLDQGVHPKLHRKLPSNTTPYFFKDLGTAIEGADLIIGGVSSPGVDWLAEVLSTKVQEHQLVVLITKGVRIDGEGGISLFPSVIANHFPENVRKRVIPAAVGGPCIAGELAARRQTCVMLGSRNLETAKTCVDLMSTKYYHMQPTDDLLSLELGVAMKNAYTVAVGMAYGMRTDDEANADMHNTAAALFAQGCYEIGGLMQLAGGNERLSSALPGAGDLYVTSAGGRTMRLGRLLGEGKLYSQAQVLLEGVTLESVQVIREMSRALVIWEQKDLIRPRSFPLLRMLIDVVVNGKEISIPYDDFFKGV